MLYTVSKIKQGTKKFKEGKGQFTKLYCYAYLCQSVNKNFHYAHNYSINKNSQAVICERARAWHTYSEIIFGKVCASTYASVYVCLSIHTDPCEQILKWQIQDKNKGERKFMSSYTASFGLKKGFFSKLKTGCGLFQVENWVWQLDIHFQVWLSQWTFFGPIQLKTLK